LSSNAFQRGCERWCINGTEGISRQPQQPHTEFVILISCQKIKQQHARMHFRSIPIAANAGLPTAALQDDDAASAAFTIETIRSQLQYYQHEFRIFEF